MPRPKSDDPKEAVTLRLPASVLARWKAGGDDWRVRMERLLGEGPLGEEIKTVRRAIVGKAAGVALPAAAAPAKGLPRPNAAKYGERLKKSKP